MSKYTRDDENTQDRFIFISALKGKKPMLNIRQRIIFARMAPLSRPVSADKLARELGGLMKNETITSNLKKLSAHGLAQRVKGGWLAVPPTNDVLEKHFVRYKPDPKKWYKGLASWRMPLPAEQPFKARNGVELYALYWFLVNLEQRSQGKSAKRLAALLRTRPQTITKLMGVLLDSGLVNEEGETLPHTFKIQQRKLPEKNDKGLPCLDSLGELIRNLSGRKEIQEVCRQLHGTMSRDALYKLVRQTLKEHNPQEHPGDGSALVLWRLRQIEVGKTVKAAVQAQAQRRAMDEGNARALMNTIGALTDRLVPNDRHAIDWREYDMATLETVDIALTGKRGFTADEMRQYLASPETISESLQLRVPFSPEHAALFGELDRRIAA